MAKQKVSGQMHATIMSAHAGDPLAKQAAYDMHQEMEHLDGTLSPYVTGKAYLIQETTLYYIGRVIAQGPGWLILADASWVHWTGRLSTLLERQSFSSQGWPSGDHRPRTEKCPNPVIIHWGSQGISGHIWTGELPTTSIIS